MLSIDALVRALTLDPVGADRYRADNAESGHAVVFGGQLLGQSIVAAMQGHDGKSVKTLHTSKDYFPSQDPTLGPVSRFFDGESTTEVGLDASLHNDVWAAVAPDIAKIRPRIDEGDRLFDKAADDLSAEQSNQFLALALKGLASNYATSPPPARFRFEINPMVSWIWIGGLIVVLSGILAGWPSPRGATRTVSARYAARVGADVRGHEHASV